MTYHELAERVSQLPIQQRLALIDVITRSLQVDLSNLPADMTSESEAQSQATNMSSIPPQSALRRIRGIGASGTPLTDAAVDALLSEARIEKFLR
jgi:hypothetical protein